MLCRRRVNLSTGHTHSEYSLSRHGMFNGEIGELSYTVLQAGGLTGGAQTARRNLPWKFKDASVAARLSATSLRHAGAFPVARPLQTRSQPTRTHCNTGSRALARLATVR